ncbi:MAG: basic amino acid ABC transporter substrate-binding protein [Thermoplasmatota archaeon]
MLPNRKIIFTLIVTAGIIMSSLAFSGCSEEDKIVVGTSADFEPFEYKEGGEIVGFDIELVKAILKDQGYENIEVRDMDFGTLIGAVQQGKIDVVAAAMTITDEREEKIDFSDPYYEADQSIIVRQNSEITLEDPQELENYVVGAQAGTTGAGWIEENLVNNGTMSEDDFERYSKYTLALQDLLNDRIDAIVLDKPVAQAFERNEDVKIIETISTGEQYGFGVKEDRDKLLNNINDGLENIMDTEEWDELVNKYFKE